MIKIRNFIVFLIIISLLPISSCEFSPETQKYEASFFDFFDTVTVITGYEEKREDFDEVADEIKELLAKYHRLFDIYNEYEGINNIAVINNTYFKEQKPIEVDKEIIELLEFSQDIYELSNGKVNISMGSVLSIWHGYRMSGKSDPDNPKLPSIDELNEANLHTDINNIIIDKEKMTVLISDDKTKLDVGAIAKGFACEKIAKYLSEKGITGYLINIGGNVRALGDNPDGEPWIVGVENPNRDDKKNPYIAVLNLKDMALVTSGSYQRFYTVNGKNYHHIIDPETLMPSERYLSVSVLSRDSGLADALSTALFNMTYEEGFKLIENINDTEAVWVMPQGEVRYSHGLTGYLC